MNAPTGELLEREITLEPMEQAAHQPPATRQGAQLSATQPPATSLLEALTRAASDPNIDITKMREAYELYKDMRRLDAEAAFNAALARAQEKMEPIVRNAKNDHTNSTYATLGAINRAIVPLYTAEGLSVSCTTETKNDEDPIPEGWMRTVGWLRHAAGHKERYHIDLPPDAAGAKGNTNKTGVQAAGSTTSYGRRYLTCLMFNISTGDDNDGNAPPKDNAEKIRQHREQQAARDAAGQGGGEQRGEPTEKPAYTEANITANLPAWRGLVSGDKPKKTPEQIINQLRMRYTVTDEQAKRIKTDLLKAAGVTE